MIIPPILPAPWDKTCTRKNDVHEKLLAIDDIKKEMAKNEDNNRKNWLLCRKIVQGVAWVELALVFLMLIVLCLGYN